MAVHLAQTGLIQEMYDEPPPEISPGDLPSGLASEIATPATVQEALSGPYAKVWLAAMRGEGDGLCAAGTFEGVGGS